MKTITFYSYKGGVGRTLAAANFAVYLAKLGLKTVIIDFDLEAPGIDAKFHNLRVPEDHKGLLDYILHYQIHKQELCQIQDICIKVPFGDSTDSIPLWLIPSGQYLSENYYKQLNQLDWGKIFSDELNGVAFFQQFIAYIKEDLQADFVIIDSRTGITEIAGLCTQQLADEVVMLSSMSSESIKVTKHIKNLIQKSQVAQALDKKIDVKVVVSRVPKPEDITTYKIRCCKRFEVEDNKLFFLFSSSLLEQEEFLALVSSDKDEELLNNYVVLFYGLNVELADENIREKVENLSKSLLSVPRQESEKRILEMAAMYPHPEVYRAAMMFFYFTRNEKQWVKFGLKVFDLLPDDEQSQNLLLQRYLELGKKISRNSSKSISDEFVRNFLKVVGRAWEKAKLEPDERIIYANLLADIEQYQKALEVIQFPVDLNPNLDDEMKIKALITGVRVASTLSQTELAEEYALSVIAVCKETSTLNKPEHILATAKNVLKFYYNKAVLEEAVIAAEKLNSIDNLEKVLESSEYDELLKPKYKPKIVEDVYELGLHSLAYYIEGSF